MAGPEPDPLAGLHGFRLPPDVPLQALADSAAALGIGLALAALLAPLALRLTRRRARPPDLRARVLALRAQPDEIRVPALLTLLQSRAPEAAARYREGLYRPGGLPDPAELERALAEAR